MAVNVYGFIMQVKERSQAAFDVVTCWSVMGKNEMIILLPRR